MGAMEAEREVRRWRVTVQLLDPDGDEQPAPVVVEARSVRGALMRAGALPSFEWKRS